MVIQLPGKIPKSDWLREVVFQLNRYLKFLMKSSVIFDIYPLVRYVKIGPIYFAYRHVKSYDIIRWTSVQEISTVVL